MKNAASVLMGLFLLAAGTVAGAAQTAAPAAAKPDLAKGQALVSQTCGACHTADGSRGTPTYPILQGQHAEYLVKQLTDFKSGKRKNPIMSGMAAPLSPEDVRNVAAFYASKTAKPGFAKSKDMAALGEKIYRGGIASRQVPACAACHSPTGAGIPVQYPRVGGQQAEYTATQLTAFRDGTRNNGPQMASVTANLHDDEIKALADYMAGLR